MSEFKAEVVVVLVIDHELPCSYITSHLLKKKNTASKWLLTQKVDAIRSQISRKQANVVCVVTVEDTYASSIWISIPVISVSSSWSPEKNTSTMKANLKANYTIGSCT